MALTTRDGSDSSVYRLSYGWKAWIVWQGRRFLGIWSRPHARKANRLPGCCEKFCDGWTNVYHYYCERCTDALTCNRKLVTDPTTLRRRMMRVCTACESALEITGQEHHARVARARDDWEKVTAPVNGKAIVADEMPEQYPARTRAAIRAFRESGSDFAVVPDVAPAALQNSIVTLGFDEEMYAEQRDSDTVIRRVPVLERGE